MLLYQEGARRMILALKHGDRLDIAKAAARWMAPKALDLLPPDGAIVPVPLHWTRLLKRRYNQAALLAHGISRLTGRRAATHALIRVKRTNTQEGKDRDSRIANVSGSMAVRASAAEEIRGRPVLLVDDVMTSGATFAEATRAIVAAGAGPISVLALARVVKA